MENVIFEPWVGKNYQKGLYDKKVLVIGEAHYCESPEEFERRYHGDLDLCRKKTSFEIQENLTDESKSPSEYTKIVKMVLGLDSNKVLTSEEKEEFWNSIAFYNYVQNGSIVCSDNPPTKDMWDLSKKAFYSVVEDLNPDFILVLGEELWENIPGEKGTKWPEGPVIKAGDISQQTWYYERNGKEIMAMPIYKPSGPAFSHITINFNPLIRKAIEMAKNVHPAEM